MTDPAAPSATAPSCAERLAPRFDLAGDAASADKLARLSKAARGKPSGKSAKGKAGRETQFVLLLRAAVKAIGTRDYASAIRSALDALNIDERHGLAWHIMAIAQEKAGHLQQAFSAYESAIKLLPDDRDVAHDLGKLAHRLGHLTIAEKLLVRFLAKTPGDVEATNNLACVLRDQNRYGEAIDLLRDALAIHPEQAILWNTLGTVLSERGDVDTSVTFYDEALRLDAGFYKARYNRANVLANLGDPHAALADIALARQGTDDPNELAVMGMATALTQLSVGDLRQGFETYEARFDPSIADAVTFQGFGARWSPDDDLHGRTMVVYGEQGLGDEVLFANVLGDVLTALGPEGRMILLVERRLVPLFQRSYPTATVLAHHSVRHLGRLVRMPREPRAVGAADLWTPIASLFRRFRTRIADFPATPAFLTPDPARVAHWRNVLATLGPGPKVGVMWKSLQMTGSRVKAFSPFEQWREVMRTDGVHFVNLQYGDTAELDAARAAGIDVWTPPGLDLKDDLDDLAALCRTLDIVTGPATATTNIAAATGTPVWMIAMPDAWTPFGTDHMPCYPGVRLFRADAVGQWQGVMGRLAQALDHEAAQRHAA